MAMTIREEQYLAKIAGEDVAVPTPLTREEALLDKIAKNGGGGGGSDLPEVNADDNGKVLAVVEGKWDKADAPSGVVIFPISLDGPIEIANASDVYEALNANISVYFDASFQGTNLRYTPIIWDSASLGILGFNLNAQEPDFTPVTLIFNHIASGDKFQLQSN